MKKWIVHVLAIVLAIMVAGCSQQSVQEPGPDKVAVSVVKAELNDIQKYFTYSGRIEPATEVDVNSRTMGEVSEIIAEVGQGVKKGEVLFSLDKKSVESNIKMLESQLRAADAGVVLAENAYDMAMGSSKESQLNQSRTALEQAKIQYDNAEQSYDDSKILYEKNAIPKQQFDQVESSYKQAGIALQNLQKAYDLLVGSILEESIDNAGKQLEQAVFQWESLSSQLEQAKLDLDDMTVKSPIDGIVSYRGIEKGELAGNGPSYRVADLSTVYVELDIPEKNINQIRLGQRIDVYVEAASGELFAGIITRISPAPDTGTYTYPVRVSIDNKDNLIKSGMYASADIEIESKEKVLVVPRNIVRKNGGRSFVYTVGNGIARETKVVTGIDNGLTVEIVSGLDQESLIVEKGLEYLENSDPVQIVDKMAGEGE